MSLGRCAPQLQSKSPVTKPRLTAVVKRGASENRLTQTMNVIVGSPGKQRPVNSDDGCAKVVGNLRRSTFPRGSRRPEMELITVKKCDRGCRTSARKSDIHPQKFHGV